MARRAQRRRSGAKEAADSGSINPVEILQDWWQAIRLSASALTATPFNLFGMALPKPKKGEVATAVRGFPVIGLAVGLIAAVVYAVAYALGLPPLVSAILAVATVAFIGGGGNESELARLADTLISGGSKTQQLARLKEPNIGGYGIVVLILCLGLRAGALASLATPLAVAAALGASLAVSYAAIAAALFYLPPARRSGFAFLAGRPDSVQTVLATLLAAAIALLLLWPVTGVVALAIGAAGAFKFAWFGKHNLGGTTRAVLGGVQQGAEIGVLLAIVALA
ncbi:MAG: adenosylcobinamide-GDP ribazoletransferase [Alphaproteobacteria bacterium]|nr:adenosylcobinamide-GDP ribazoletransferase [Alphaproteobacteria bacterium]